MGFSFGGFNMFLLFRVIFFIMFFTVLGIIIMRLIQGAMQWNRNNKSPVLTVDAVVVAKRADVSHYHHTDSNNMSYMNSSTTYYVTFEVPSGDRMELRVSDREYGMLVEHDVGKLTFQGTRYLGFERQI
jgi:urease beta subunit